MLFKRFFQDIDSVCLRHPVFYNFLTACNLTAISRVCRGVTMGRTSLTLQHFTAERHHLVSVLAVFRVNGTKRSEQQHIWWKMFSPFLQPAHCWSLGTSFSDGVYFGLNTHTCSCAHRGDTHPCFLWMQICSYRSTSRPNTSSWSVVSSQLLLWLKTS